MNFDIKSLKNQGLLYLDKSSSRLILNGDDEYSATGVPPIRKSGTAFPRKVYRLSAKVYRSFFRL